MKMMETSLNGSEALTKFYQSKFYFSYSGLNKLLYSPAMFYSHYVLNEREDRTDAHLVGGRVLHCLLFEPDTYDDNFTSLPGKLPTDSQRKIIDTIFKKYFCFILNQCDRGGKLCVIHRYMSFILCIF